MPTVPTVVDRVIQQSITQILNPIFVKIFSELEHLCEQRLDNNINSFGLRGTIKRVKIYYDREDLYTIESIFKKGTKITIRIPINQEEKYK
ncbi:MAG: hypothetical protein ACYDG2_06040 [Ruminiclostridium sp.]